MAEIFGTTQDTNKKPNSKLIIIGVFVTVVILALVVVGWYYRDYVFAPQENELIKNEDVAINQTKQIDIPEGTKSSVIPKDLPWEDGVTVLQYSYDEVTATSTETKITRKYISAKSLADNMKLYSDYFSKGKDWVTTTGVNENEHKMLGAQRKDKQLYVTVDFTKNAEGKTVAMLTLTFPIGHAQKPGQPVK